MATMSSSAVIRSAVHPSLQLELLVDTLNAGRPQCPVGLNTLVVPRKNSVQTVSPENQPYVYLNCGHVQGRHAWGNVGDRVGSKELFEYPKESNHHSMLVF